MKMWNEPELKELDINQTENGIFDFIYEYKWVVNDSFFDCTPDDDKTNVHS